MKQALIIVGAGGQGRVVADIAERVGYQTVAFLDDACTGEVCGYPVLGRVEDFATYRDKGDLFVAIGGNAARRRVTAMLREAGLTLPALVHPSAVLGKGVTLGQGTVVMAGAVINPWAIVGEGVILNTGSSVDHDCRVGDFAHVSVGAHLCGTVTVGKEAFLGAGSTLVNNVSVCDGVTVGAGAVVIHDITEKGTYVGVPARRIDR